MSKPLPAAPVHRRRSRMYDLADFVSRQLKRGYVGALQNVSPTPIAPPLGFVAHKPLALQIREMVLSEQLRLAAENAGMETFEEADDFDVDDDPADPTTPYENDFDPPIRELLLAGQAELNRKKSPQPPSDGPGSRKSADVDPFKTPAPPPKDEE